MTDTISVWWHPSSIIVDKVPLPEGLNTRHKTDKPAPWAWAACKNEHKQYYKSV